MLAWEVLRNISPWKRPFHLWRQTLARLWLKLYPKVEVIAITGSVGKTTTKEMIAQVLQERFRVVKSEANLDPVFNIPRTILKLRPGDQKLVLEMGVEYPQEMDFYLSLVQPKIGVVTKIACVHTEFLGDLSGVVEEKSKLLRSLPQGGWAILNWDDFSTRQLASKTKAKVFYYGVDDKNCQLTAGNIKTSAEGVDFTLSSKEFTRGEVEVRLNLLGRHNVYCALAASSVGLISGLSLKEIKNGLEKVKPQPSRLNVLSGPKQSIIIDDSYNASPTGTQAALETLKDYPGKRKIAVLGEMRELGSYSEKGHREVGKKVAGEKIDYLLTLGNLTKFIIDEAKAQGFKKEHLFQFKTAEEIEKKLKDLLGQGDIVLIKGSRAMRMERIISGLKLA